MMARIMQSHYQKGGRKVRTVKRQLLKVLYATDMPSVLTELGFMTNKSELAYMNSEKGQNAYARMLCNAVKEYVSHINRLAGVTTTMVEPAEAEDVAEPESAVKSEPQPKKESTAKSELQPQKEEVKAEVSDGYAIQLLASDKRVKSTDSQFKSYKGKVKCYIGGGVLKYKYCYGTFATRAEAQRNLAEVRRSFKDAFVVHYNDDRIVK